MTALDDDYMVEVLTGVVPSRLSQLFLHTANPDPSPGDPPESIGDCYRTAIACLLGAPTPEYVPHFAAMNLEITEGWEAWRLAREHLRNGHDLDLAWIDRPAAVELGVPYLATAPSKRGDWNHCLVIIDGEVHDPSGTDDYTLADIFEDAATVLARPYDPDPTAQVAELRRTAADEVTT